MVICNIVFDLVGSNCNKLAPESQKQTDPKVYEDAKAVI